MKKALFKDTLREVWKTKSRFLSIAAIVALGTGFFCGIKMTAPNMKDSADKYYKESLLGDFHVMGNYGITEDDLVALKEVEGVKEVVGGYSVDLFVYDENDQNIVKVYSYPSDLDIESESYLNRPALVEGRFPKAKNECVVENSLKAPASFFVGNTLNFKNGDPDTELSDSIDVDFCNIVGVVKSPMYINFERGSAQIGNGEISGYIMLHEDNFTYEVFTDAYVALDDSFKYSSFSEEYEDLVDTFTEKLEKLGEERSTIRYQEIMDEANEKIADAEEELADAKVKIEDAEDELADGKKTQQTEVAKARKELADAKQELLDGQKDYDEAYAEYIEEIEDAKQKIADGWDEYYEGLAKYQSGKVEAKEQLSQAQKQVNSLKDFASSTTQLSGAIANGYASADAASSIVAALNQMQPGSGDQLQQAIDYSNLMGDTSYVTGALSAVSQSLTTQANSAQDQIDDGYDQLDKGEKKLVDAYKELQDAEIELEDAILEAEQEFADARVELEDGKEKIADAEVTLEEEVAKADKEIADGEVKIANAWVEYNDALLELADAKEEIADLDEAKWYVFDRTAKPGYGDYGVDAERIDKIAGVFPFFFILIAALICFTTMTRMVEEQRTQIGTLKALGYGDRTIMSKYLLYAATASVIGSIVGLTIGFPLFPKIIFGAYSIMYDLPDIDTPFHVWVAVGATLVAIICTTVAAYYAGIKELKSQPSQLMRPKVPKSGKKILLERWKGLWNKLSFSYKVTVRNISRYKSRVALTVIGIGGCTALMLTGFGLHHSISSIATKQFVEIFHYDIMAAINSDLTPETIVEVEQWIEDTPEIIEYTYVYSQNVDINDKNDTYNTTLFIMEHPELADRFINFKVRETQEPIELTDNGAIINEKLARLLKLDIGDTFAYEVDGTVANITVSAICENYAMNYVYMTPTYYRQMYAEDIERNTFIANVSNLTEESKAIVSTRLLENDEILGVQYVKEFGDKFMDLLGALDIIIVVLIICSGLLAFVVLYNLTNISVNERIRELATIKVLGFYDTEVSAYIYRENMFSALIGIIFGLFIGIYFHRFVVQTAEVDVVMFDPTIGNAGFIYSAILTMLFTFIVNFALHFRLKKIDMVESLKSVE
ncbi:MAG: FtsX-like permease family protein [Erysipelotrichales bacterium]|nr:FtsX-like permease family protein [Erysipelotrichales bacterium]